MFGLGSAETQAPWPYIASDDPTPISGASAETAGRVGVARPFSPQEKEGRLIQSRHVPREQVQKLQGLWRLRLTVYTLSLLSHFCLSVWLVGWLVESSHEPTTIQEVEKPTPSLHGTSCKEFVARCNRPQSLTSYNYLYYLYYCNYSLTSEIAGNYHIVLSQTQSPISWELHPDVDGSEVDKAS